MRSDFLPESDRGEAAGLLREYVDVRLAAVQSRDPDQMRQVLVESDRIQRQLWDMAVVNARKDMNSDVAALYIESLNELINLHALRVAVGLQTRIPAGIWLVLYALVMLGMIGVGYQTAIAGSRRSWAMPILALSFSLVIALIASLDRPQSGYITVSQQPLVDVKPGWPQALAPRKASGGVCRGPPVREYEVRCLAGYLRRLTLCRRLAAYDLSLRVKSSMLAHVGRTE